MPTYRVPITPQPQVFNIDMAGVTYTLELEWRNYIQQHSGWFLSIAQAGERVLENIPLVTGVDLLGQYEHLNIGGSLVVQSDAGPLRAPTMNNLGLSSNLYFITP